MVCLVRRGMLGGRGRDGGLVNGLVERDAKAGAERGVEEVGGVEEGGVGDGDGNGNGNKGGNGYNAPGDGSHGNDSADRDYCALDSMGRWSLGHRDEWARCDDLLNDILSSA